MIDYKFFQLANGLKVYVVEDNDTSMAVLNILYNVGSKDETEDRTGFAHLFEHLMFGGSKNIPSYDEPLQKVGGENNAFTSPDITNYYITLPAANLETAFWLESDRMLSLSFDPKVLEIQRNVVIEEFKQRYLNQPYGDVWLKLRPVVYESHPYRWPTIGKEISHIETATMDMVKDFFYKYYLPNNAIMVVAGNVSLDQVKSLAEKWFAPIPKGEDYKRNLVKEQKQKSKRLIEVEADVPLNAFYKVFKMPGRLDENYYAIDLLSDILGRGKTSRLYEALVVKEHLFSSISAGHMGSVESPGMFYIEGKLMDGVDFELAESKVNEVVAYLKNEGVSENELVKVKNQSETILEYTALDLLEKAMHLAYFANLGQPEMVNKEAAIIASLTTDDINKAAELIFEDSQSTVMFYKKRKYEN